ncbi:MULTISPECIES: type VII secretion target [Actinosynnema]|uniref:type VII secretion target n=1 Tax=Actinosynnema TaxID=40566 RepID=UPI0020A50EC2|nr:type VII secretion target [Actinosynnema pretiosum]MCP2092083.1 Excreted virulence factor EspC, type VII ESX diderm [Actinosynnema pretiosum]
MSAGGYAAVPEELRAHGSHLEGLVDRLAAVAAKAGDTAMPGDAYGSLCSFLPKAVTPLGDQVGEVLSAAAEGVSASAHGVRGTAADYEDNETIDPFTRLVNGTLGGAR